MGGFQNTSQVSSHVLHRIKQLDSLIEKSQPTSYYPLDLHILLLELLSGVFALCLIIFVGVHTNLLFTNRTTIESMEGSRRVRLADNTMRIARDVNIYDLGWRLNVREVFGDNMWLWFLPVASRYAQMVYFCCVKKAKLLTIS